MNLGDYKNVIVFSSKNGIARDLASQRSWFCLLVLENQHPNSSVQEATGKRQCEPIQTKIVLLHR